MVALESAKKGSGVHILGKTNGSMPLLGQDLMRGFHASCPQGMASRVIT